MNEHSRAEKIVSDLQRLHNRISRNATLGPVFMLIALLFSGAALVTLLESSLYLTAWGKSAGWIAIVAFSLFVYRQICEPGSRQPFREFYRTFCRQSGLEEAGNALDLYLDSRTGRTPFQELAIRRNLEWFQPENWVQKQSDFLRNSPHRRRFLTGSILLVVSLLLFGSISYSYPDAALRSLAFWTSEDMPNPYRFTILPGDRIVEYGNSFTPTVEYSGGHLPNQVTLALKTDIENEYRRRPMRPEGNGTYSAGELELTGDGVYFVEMDGFRSEEYRIEVRHLPRFESLTAMITPPSYTELGVSEQEYPFARIRAYGGSEVVLTGRLNKPVEGIRLTQSNIDRPMEMADPDSFSFEYTFTVERNDTLSFEMIDRDGLTNRNPFRFTVQLIQDEYPSVTILEPEQTVRHAEPSELEIHYRAADDFGLTGAELNWELRRAFTTEPHTGSARLDTPVRSGVNRHVWDLDSLDLRPRDRLEVTVSVRDNDSWNGYKYTRSRPILLEIPSMSAWMEEIEQKERSVGETINNASEEYREMEDEYREFRNRLQENPEPGWEEQQMLEDVKSQQEDVEDSITRLQEQFEEIRREFEENSMVSDETRNAYRQLQNLMDELDDPELRSALEELQELLGNLNAQELQQALEQFEFNEQVFRERLERTVELFKALKMNSDLDRLARQYDELGNRMETTTDETRPAEEILDEMRGVREDTGHLDRQLENLNRNPPERNAARLEQLQDESRQELGEIRQELEELIQESDRNPGEDLSGRAERRENIGERFRERAETLREAQQQMSGQQIQINLLAMQQSLYTLIELSESQENIAVTSGETATRSQGFVDLARRQNNINNLFRQVSDTLTQVASEIPSLSGTISRKKVEVEQSLSRARNQLTERDQRMSVIASREALGGINDLASMLATAIDQLMDQQDGAGGSMSMQQMLEQMQQMSGDQQELNRQLQEFINDIQGERLTREQSDRLEQLTQQQNEIRRKLQELQRNGALREGDRSLSEIQRMLEEMEDAINDMRGGMTDPIMVRRQQNILSRMLDAEESLQERGEEEDEYRGRSADPYQRATPPDVSLEELLQEIRTRLHDPAYTRFRDEYQLLIERYFELLREADPEL
ncbi:MAG: DUF4175 family protein [Balneolaceae bacterium]